MPGLSPRLKEKQLLILDNFLVICSELQLSCFASLETYAWPQGGITYLQKP